jgi:hypothetical protein
MMQAGPVGVVVVAVVAAPDVIVIPTFTLWVRDPLVPSIDRVKDPVEAEEDALTVSEEVAVEPEGGVIGPGRVTETPLGADPSQE